MKSIVNDIHHTLELSPGDEVEIMTYAGTNGYGSWSHGTNGSKYVFAAKHPVWKDLVLVDILKDNEESSQITLSLFRVRRRLTLL